MVGKFPDLTRRYQKFIGAGAVLSSAVIVLTTIAINKRLTQGESVDKILAQITPEEIETAGKKSRLKFSKKENKKQAPPPALAVRNESLISYGLGFSPVRAMSLA